jgi:glyoxylase-like metal-dependent hydrolase (beta-lactamase superfamily II)
LREQNQTAEEYGQHAIITYMQEIASDLAIIPMTIANAYLAGTRECWVLIDAGIPGNEGRIQEAAVKRFGPGAKPQAILLTHGHFDHAGSASDLADFWRVPIYVHSLEFPYLTGKCHYPPLDPTGTGFFSILSRFFPSSTVNLGSRLVSLNETGPAPHMPDWDVIYTPGHTPGHVAFFRRSDGALIAGDAVTTMNLDSLIGTLMRKPELCRPPKPATTNWQRTHESVRKLAELRPSLIAAGHGPPMRNAAADLQRLADNFPIPRQGRYVTEPVQADENGIVYLPPKPPDPVPRIAAGVAIGLGVAAIASVIISKNQSRG